MYYGLQVKPKLRRHESAENYEYNKMENLGENWSFVAVNQKQNDVFGINYCADHSTIKEKGC